MTEKCSIVFEECGYGEQLVGTEVLVKHGTKLDFGWACR